MITVIVLLLVIVLFGLDPTPRHVVAGGARGRGARATLQAGRGQRPRLQTS